MCSESCACVLDKFLTLTCNQGDTDVMKLVVEIPVDPPASSAESSHRGLSEDLASFLLRSLGEKLSGNGIMG